MGKFRVGAALGALVAFFGATAAAPAAYEAIVEVDSSNTWACGQSVDIVWGVADDILDSSPVALYLAGPHTDPALLLVNQAFKYSDQRARVALDCNAMGIAEARPDSFVAVALAAVDENTADIVAMSQEFTVGPAATTPIEVLGPAEGTILSPGTDMTLRWSPGSSTERLQIGLYGLTATGDPVLLAWLASSAANNGQAHLTIPTTIQPSEYPRVVIGLLDSEQAAVSPLYSMVNPVPAPAPTPVQTTVPLPVASIASEVTTVTAPLNTYVVQWTPILNIVRGIGSVVAGTTNAVTNVVVDKVGYVANAIGRNPLVQRLVSTALNGFLTGYTS